MAAIRLQQVHKTFGEVAVLERVDLEIADGELFVCVGPSGCGKSTLLRLIAGLEDVTAGEIWIGDTRVTERPPADRGIAMVFQSYALYPHMNVYENLAFGLRVDRDDPAEIDRRVRDAAQLLELGPLLERLPRQLSGGQRQRVAIGRAITRQPKVFLFDEPLSNLDAGLRAQTRSEIAKLHRRLGTTMIYVTHDQVEAMTLADRILILNDGAVAQLGDPRTIYHRPCNRFVAGFIGSPRMSFLEAELVSADASGAELMLAGGVRVQAAVDARGVASGSRVSLGVRPEQMGLASGTAGVPGEVERVEHLGDCSLVYVATAGSREPLVVRLEVDSATRRGDAIRLAVPAAAWHVFDASGAALPRLVMPESP